MLGDSPKDVTSNGYRGDVSARMLGALLRAGLVLDRVDGCASPKNVADMES